MWHPEYHLLLDKRPSWLSSWTLPLPSWPHRDIPRTTRHMLSMLLYPNLAACRLLRCGTVNMAGHQKEKSQPRSNNSLHQRRKSSLIIYCASHSLALSCFRSMGGNFRTLIAFAPMKSSRHSFLRPPLPCKPLPFTRCLSTLSTHALKPS
jgi:hypothetical protein